MAEQAQTGLVSVSYLASLFSKSPRWIHNLREKSVLTAIKSGSGYRYNPRTAVQEYIAYLEARLEAKESKDPEDTGLRRAIAETAIKEYKARLLAMDVAEQEGSMHRSEDVELFFMDFLFTVRERLNSMPDVMSVDLERCKTAARMRIRLKKEVNEILTELSTHKYNADKYKQLARTRRGYKEEVVDDDL